MIEMIFNYQFMQNAMISSLLISLICGVIGAIVIEKRIVMLSGGIAHASFGGIGLGYLLGFEPIIGGMLFSLLGGIGIVKIRQSGKTSEDTLIGILWSMGMALGILFIALTPGYPPDMTSYLFGDILTVSSTDLFFIFVLSVLILFPIMMFYNYLKSYLFDETFLRSQGVNTFKMEYILFAIIGLSIVVLIKAAGVILVISLLTVPAATLKLYTKRFKLIIIFSAILGFMLCIGGIVISYYFNIPSGASIILLSGLVYGVSYLVKK